MNYYILSNSTDEKVIGCYPQTDGMGYEYDLNKSSSVWKLSHYELPEFTPDLDFFKLDRKARLTDMVSTGLSNTVGFLVNERVKKIFEQFKLPKHAFFPAKLMHKAQKLDYFWFQFGEDLAEKNIIDFTRSKFILRHPLPWKKDTIDLSIHSTDELLQIHKEQTDIKKIFPMELYLNDIPNRDLLVFSTFWKGIYISEQLKQAMLSQRITGFDVKESFPIFIG